MHQTESLKPRFTFIARGVLTSGAAQVSRVIHLSLVRILG